MPINNALRRDGSLGDPDRARYPPDPQGHLVLVTRVRVDTCVVRVVSGDPVDAAKDMEGDDWELLDESYSSEPYDE